MAGGVKWRKLGIFMSSAFANLPGAVFPGLTQPWCSGNGTLAGWKDLATGHTDGQSWSTGILWVRGGGNLLFQAGGFLFRFCLSFLSRDLVNSSTLNSCSSPTKYENEITGQFSVCIVSRSPHSQQTLINEISNNWTLYLPGLLASSSCWLGDTTLENVRKDEKDK